MKKLLLLACLVLGSLSSVWGQITMPKTDGKAEIISVQESTKFYDPGGANASISMPANYSTSVTFVPRSGERIRITFKSLNLTGAATLSLFEGEKSLSRYYDDDEQEFVYNVPGTGHKVKLSTLSEETSYISESLDGKLTVMLSAPYTAGGDWVAEVVSEPRQQAPATEAAGDVSMSSGHAKYIIGSSVGVYDDGGKSGKITKDFEGLITFIPKTAGQKIRLTFSKLALFNTSSIGKNDLLKVYHGSVADEAKLITTLLKEPTPITLTSTAEDGSLTIYLKSTTGIPADGFEAKVEQIAPTAMTLPEVVLSQKASSHAMAGEVGVAVLGINLRTSGTLSPRKLTALDLTAEGAEHIASAKLYSLGNSANGTPKLVGTATNVAGTYSLTLSEALTLSEGDNYLSLSYDLRETAPNEARLDAGLTRARFEGGGESAPTTAEVDGKVIVQNTLHSTPGQKTIVLHGDWAFTHTPQSAYNSNYKAETGDQVTIFKPANNTAVAELHFSAFNVVFAPNTYQTKCTFIIYNGEGRSGEKLFEVDATTKDKLPLGGVVRSKNPGDALTVVFNPNTIATLNTGKGWKAVAREYEPKNMTLSSIAVSQASTDDTAIGAKNVEILGIKVAMSGNLNPAKLSALALNLKGATPERVLVYSTGADATFTTTKLVGKLESNPSGEVTIAIDPELTLLEGDNHLWIAYDLSRDQTPEQALDASLKSLTIAGTAHQPEHGDPEGHRTPKSIRLMPTSGTEELQLGAHPVVLYDAGGPNGNYPKGELVTLKVKPRDGEVVRVEIRSLTLNYSDILTFYSGTDATTTAQRIAEYKGSVTKLPAPFISTAEDGSMTLTFHAKGSRQLAGWEFVLSSYVPSAHRISEVESKAIEARAKALAGARTPALVRLAVQVAGDKDDVKLSPITLTTTGALVSKLYLYSTGEYDTYSPVNLVGETSVQNGTATITPTLSYNQAGTYYLWVAADIASGLSSEAPQAGSTLRVSAVQGMPAESLKLSAEVTLESATGLKGDYIVGADGAYATLEAALTDLKNKGVEGAVRLLLKTGTYERTEIPEIAGTSPVNTVTITSESGRAEDVVFESTKTFGNYNTNNAVLIVNSTDYLTLEHLTVKTTNPKLRSVLRVQDGAQHVSVRNCIITAPKSVNPTGEDIRLVEVAGGDTSTPYRDCDFFTLEHCQLNGGYMGVYLNGNTAVALPFQRGIRIRNNTLRDQGSKGIYSPGDEELTIEGNDIQGSGDVKGPYMALDIVMRHDIQILGNKIKIFNITSQRVGSNSANSEINAIHLRPARGTRLTFERRNLMANNVVEVMADNKTSAYALTFSEATITDLDILHNTLVLETTEGKTNVNAHALAISRRGEELKHIAFKGNIIVAEAGGSAYYFFSEGQPAGITFDKNVVYTSEGVATAKLNKTDVTWAEWQTKGYDTSSLNTKPSLNAETKDVETLGDLRLVPEDARITHDIIGRVRPSGLRTAGAYEYAEATLPTLHEARAVRTTPTEATLELTPTASGRMHVLARPKTETAPTVDDLKAITPVDIHERRPSTVQFTGLTSAVDYVCYVLFESPRGEVGTAVVSALEFRTAYPETKVSTFESIESDGSTPFVDGTARFENISVEPLGEGDNIKVGYLLENATITPTNAGNEGITLEGFHAYHEGQLTMKLTLGNGTERSVTLEGQEEWYYVDLRAYGAIRQIKLSGDEVYIDNFSGQPETFTLGQLAETLRTTLGEDAVITPEVSGGVLPYRYSWVSGNTTLATTAEFRKALTHTQPVEFTVEDARGARHTRTILVTVVGGHAVATFDDLRVGDKGYWAGVDGPMMSKFYSGSYAFDNSYFESYQSWSGFAYSALEGAGFEQLFPDQFRAATGSGYAGSKQFGIYYSGGNRYRIHPLASDGAGEVVSGMYVTNSAWVKHTSEHGTGMGSEPNVPFHSGDWLSLTAYGDNGKSKVMYLADYRDADPRQHYTLDSWQWFDLSELGEVKSIYFKLDGTRANSYGSTIPFYFCFDNLGGTPSRVALTPQAGTTGKPLELDLATLLSAHLPAKWRDIASFAVETPQSGSNLTTSISGSRLTLRSENSTEETIRLSAYGAGERIFFELPVRIVVDTALDTPEVGALQIVPTIADSHIRLTRSGKLEIFSLAGARVMSLDYTAGEAVDISHLSSGLYIARLDGIALRWQRK